MEHALTTQPNDTICAVSTPPGSGGIAVIRISGKDAVSSISGIWRGTDLTKVPSHTLHLGHIIDPEDNYNVLDEAVAAIFRAHRSYTGDETIELSIHGSKYIQRRLIRILTEHCGIRLAEPGEFTMRAFSSGRLSLTQAEAVADIIAASSKAAHRIATTQFSGKTHFRLMELRKNITQLAALLELELDFSEEDVTFADRKNLLTQAELIRSEITRLLKSFDAGKAIKEGIPVALTGPTNAGKSSLLNRLIDDDRAIVSDIHGTTRDTIEETAIVGDYLFRFIDTAGLRETDDKIEQLGIQRSREAVGSAHITLLVLDAATSNDSTVISSHIQRTREIMPAGSIILVLLNKSDLVNTKYLILPGLQDLDAPVLPISAKKGDGIDTLLTHLCEIAAEQDSPTDIMITNERHRRHLRDALDSINTVIDGLQINLTTDLIAIDLRQTIHHLALLTGDITTPDILTHIFSHFCIGK